MTSYGGSAAYEDRYGARQRVSGETMLKGKLAIKSWKRSMICERAPERNFVIYLIEILFFILLVFNFCYFVIDLGLPPPKEARAEEGRASNLPHFLQREAGEVPAAQQSAN